MAPWRTYGRDKETAELERSSLVHLHRTIDDGMSCHPARPVAVDVFLDKVDHGIVTILAAVLVDHRCRVVVNSPALNFTK